MNPPLVRVSLKNDPKPLAPVQEVVPYRLPRAVAYESGGSVLKLR